MIFMGNVFLKPERSWWFHPCHWGSPNAITPDKVITAVSHSAGAVRGTGTVPSIKACVLFNSFDNQGNSTVPFYRHQVRYEY